MKTLHAVTLIASLVPTMPSLAATVKTPVVWKIGATSFEGVLVYDDTRKTPRPGLILVPNWMGVTDANVAQAAAIAGTRYVILVADVYGKAQRPTTAETAGKAAGALKADRQLLRQRVNKALEVLLAQAGKAPLDPGKVGAIGFCFGGAGALELARSGANVAGTVTFHGTLSSPTPADAKAIRGKVLALHGADDPYVPAAEVQGFEDEMRGAGVDWQLVKLGGAVHSFTDPAASAAGTAQYNPLAARRAFTMMNAFFDEVFGVNG
ncbi:MAG: dienelactone hydrolase family protein [Pseudomonadota bacterium]